MNIVFDLGGVVFTWAPEKIIASVFADPEARAQVYSQVLCHEDWNKLDRGTLSHREAAQLAGARTGLPVSEIAAFFKQVPIAMVEIPETVALLHRLKKRGHRLFCLSNMHRPTIEHLERSFTHWDVFEGGVISCRIHWIKPEPEIFQHLLETYGLDPTETVFIDDMDINVAAGADAGMRTIKFENPAQCKSRLQEMSCI